jgi:ribosomal protein S12 methylthiotransferase
MTKRAQNTYHLISLGCPKNLVDSESMAQLLNQQGLAPVGSAQNAKYLIVNTCGFLQAAREEAIAVLTDLASEKMPWQKLIAAGCMTEHHREVILHNVPGIDGLLGTRRWMDIVDVIKETGKQRQGIPYAHFPSATRVGRDESGTIRAAVQGGSAYLKIAEGCRRACAYCMIPLIKGDLVSRPINHIVDDAKILQDQGVQEIILIAQDITDYGSDLHIKEGLTSLLEELIKAVPAIPWIRLMYTFPGYITEPLIQLMASEPQILPYIDIPLQHADPEILRAMRRPKDIHAVRQMLANIRTKIPGVALRTTFIVGYPGENEPAFQNLIRFVQSVRFDHLGAFTYSFEPGTPAEPLGDPIPEEIKATRLEQLMQVQAAISLERNQRFIGERLNVLVEGVDDENQISIGRSYRDAPEIDGLVIIEGRAPIGKIVKVQINSAITHDLVGILLEEESKNQ